MHLSKSGDEYYVMATALTESAMQAAGKTDYEILGTLKGSDLEYMKTAHPFIDRTSLVIVGDHVTLESGTGCVHTAPGHGVEDFEVCRNHYPEIPIVVPVDSHGKLTEEAGPVCRPDHRGSEQGDCQASCRKQAHCLLCRRSSTSIRTAGAARSRSCSARQSSGSAPWTLFKDQAVEAIKERKVDSRAGAKTALPPWCRDRNDWCISRQRRWGVPIPIFYCKDCGEPLIDEETRCYAVSELFRAEGSDAWYIKEAEEILPAGIKLQEVRLHVLYKRNATSWTSGLIPVLPMRRFCETRDYLNWPADLYLEGADQYRGWFQSSLLTVRCMARQSAL